MIQETTPPIMTQEIVPMVSNWNPKLMRSESERKAVYSDLTSRAIEAYHMKHIQLNGKMYEVGRDH